MVFKVRDKDVVIHLCAVAWARSVNATGTEGEYGGSLAH